MQNIWVTFSFLRNKLEVVSGVFVQKSVPEALMTSDDREMKK